VKGTLAVARYTLIDLSRRRILLVFFIIGLLGILGLGVGLKIIYSVSSSSSQGGFGPNDVDPAVFNHFLELLFLSYIFGALGVFGLLIAYGVGMTAIYHDLDSGAAVSIFSKPVSRLAFTTGKIVAAVAALLVIMGLLAVETRIVMLLFGGGLESALTGAVLAVVGNTVVIMLLVLALSTWMNNIVAAVVAFVYYNVLSGVIVFVHNLLDNGVIGNDILKAVFNVLYWMVPHELVSSAAGDLVRAQVAIQGTRGSTAVAGVPAASSAGDIVWWAFVVCVFCGLVYYSVRRRQV
jgi:ABC-type transport system involved in multi-copper enzyme maturation permease subunit